MRIAVTSWLPCEIPHAHLMLAKQTILNELALEGPLGCGCALCQGPAFLGEG